MAELGRRDRKRLRTRDAIAEAARTLFAARGFDGVTVAEIADVADVSEQTVYNHFPTKEDLVLWRRGTFEAELLQAIGARPPGESALAAFHRFLIRPPGRPDDAAARERAGDVVRAAVASGPSAQVGTIVDSSRLRARERSIVAGYTASLAAMLAEDTGAEPDDIEPQVAAAAMLGVSQALIDHARRRVVEGANSSDLTRDLRARADRAVQLLAGGLGGYAVRTGER